MEDSVEFKIELHVRLPSIDREVCPAIEGEVLLDDTLHDQILKLLNSHYKAGKVVDFTIHEADLTAGAQPGEWKPRALSSARVKQRMRHGKRKLLAVLTKGKRCNFAALSVHCICLALLDCPGSTLIMLCPILFWAHAVMDMSTGELALESLRLSCLYKLACTDMLTAIVTSRKCRISACRARLYVSQLPFMLPLQYHPRHRTIRQSAT